MKTLKTNKKESKVTRELITAFGERIYHQDEVKETRMMVRFKDGSSIEYHRAETKDLREKIEKEIEEEDDE
ncbi:MAG: hypothetical protein WCP89_04225, partial [archaeon]